MSVNDCEVYCGIYVFRVGGFSIDYGVMGIKSVIVSQNVYKKMSKKMNFEVCLMGIFRKLSYNYEVVVIKCVIIVLKI